MPKFVATQFAISLNGTALGNSIAAVTVSETAAEVETTSFGSGGYVQRVSGLKDASVSLDFHQDFGAGGVHEIVKPLLGGYATVTVVPTAGSVSPTNPSITVSALVTEYSAVDASVGDLATFSVTWPLGTGVVSYATA